MITVLATNITDCWHQAAYACWRSGYDYKIEQGSLVGQIRRQLPFFVGEIVNPGKRPLAIQFPEGMTLPLPNTEQQIEDYAIRYLLSAEIAKNELYTYGSRLMEYRYLGGKINPLQILINRLKEFKGSNQYTLEVATPFDITLSDPPCLRVIDFKVVNGRLDISVYFRSWDLWCGMPTNLGGLQILNEYVAQEVGIETGKMFMASAGLHLYSMYFDLVKARFGIE